MGTYEKGILGPVNGTVGPVVGANWRGINYLRSNSKRRSGSFTQPQLEQQAKFGLVVKFTAPLKSLLSVTYRDYAVEKTGANSATANILKNAITGSYPAFSISYPLVLVSRGDLPNAPGASATAAPGIINFSWTSNEGIGKASATDKSILVAYCPDLSMAVYTLQGAGRGAEAATLDVSLFKGHKVHTWLAFIGADRNADVSNSVYTGEFVVA